MKKRVGRLLCLLAMAILLAGCLGCTCNPFPPDPTGPTPNLSLSCVEGTDYFVQYLAPNDYPTLLEAHV